MLYFSCITPVYHYSYCSWINLTVIYLIANKIRGRLHIWKFVSFKRHIRDVGHIKSGEANFIETAKSSSRILITYSQLRFASLVKLLDGIAMNGEFMHDSLVVFCSLLIWYANRQQDIRYLVDILINILRSYENFVNNTRVKYLCYIIPKWRFKSIPKYIRVIFILFNLLLKSQSVYPAKLYVIYTCFFF